MPLIVKDRVQETSATTGTGTLTLSGAVTGFQTFSSAIGNTNTTYYAIQNNGTNEWEVGIGTVSAGALSRDTVLESSNSGSLVNFSAGVKNVFCTYPAEKSVDSDTSQTVSNKDITGGSINSTPIGATAPSTGRFTDLTDSGLTSGRVTYASTGGNLVDSANLTFDGTNLTAAGIQNTPIGATTPSTGAFTSVTTPTVTATTNDLTLSAISTGVIKFNTPAGEVFRITKASSSGANYWRTEGAAVTPFLITSGNNGIIATGGTGVLQFVTNSASEQMRVSHTASAVNYVQVTGSATGADPTISAQGSDADRNLRLSPKGTGQVFSTSPFVAHSLAFNSLRLAGGASTGFAPTISTQGSDTNISMAFQPKGTGAINLAAGSNGVNVSNGGTVTAITRTSSGGSYTSIPSVAITAPTTAGGVQATATATMFVGAVTIQSGGTGYTVGNVLTLVGGTNSGAATLTVSTVSAGVITAVTVTSGGTAYSVLPTNPVSVTGGSGSGATFNVTDWRVHPTFTITNAGSGYIEQPTVTFSGGGGSGASAYASVGSMPIIRSLAGNSGASSALSFHTAGGESFRVLDGGLSANYYAIQSSTANGAPQLRTLGSDTNIGMLLSTKGTGGFLFYSNGFSNQQFAVTHTASAVNYVQVTGSATGANPSITVQGSDANRSLNIGSKGTTFVILSNNSTVPHFSAGGSGSAVNYLNARGNAAGTGPALESVGTDTNIDLALTPKGTGNVRFGTLTASADVPITGYIEIKDAGGTIRRLAVVD
jgi:hypothetical protein